MPSLPRGHIHINLPQSHSSGSPEAEFVLGNANPGTPGERYHPGAERFDD